jgi:hypothetical protein
MSLSAILWRSPLTTSMLQNLALKLPDPYQQVWLSLMVFPGNGHYDAQVFSVARIRRVWGRECAAISSGL